MLRIAFCGATFILFLVIKLITVIPAPAILDSKLLAEIHTLLVMGQLCLLILQLPTTEPTIVKWSCKNVTGP